MSFPHCMLFTKSSSDPLSFSRQRCGSVAGSADQGKGLNERIAIASNGGGMLATAGDW